MSWVLKPKITLRSLMAGLLKVPESPRTCDRFLFGKINLGGSGWPKIYVMKAHRKVAELDPLELYEAEPNNNGEYELRIK